MKTERRHELQTNQLADWLGRNLEGIQPYFKSIVAVGLLLLAALFGYLIITSSQTSRLGNSWAAFLAAFGQRDAKQLDRVAESNQGTVAGLWARQSLADIKLASGSSQMYQDRDAAAEDLEAAAKAYRAVIEQAAQDAMLRQRALLGLAQASECLSILTRNESNNQKYLDEARQSYKQLAQDAAKTAIGQVAAKRLALLENLSQSSTDQENWYLWLANQELPSPPLGGDPGMFSDPSGLGGAPRVGSNTMPDRPLIDPLPERPTLDLPFGTEPEATRPTPDQPEPAEPKPAEPATDESK
ncbi:MAG: hypothetical protein J5I93_13765, partial [Pirellulaceae bacterium]|nr:hypothetical protein [Pirellulaceae bacterium]